MKVVVGVDGSDLAYDAVRFVGQLLSPKVDDLLLFCSPPAFHLTSKTELPKDVLDNASGALASAIFDKARSSLSEEMLEVTSTLRSEALPSDGLIELAEDEDVDLVVVGSQSAARKFPFVLGSTARTVVHHTGKPVLVVRGNVKEVRDSLRVVIACDEERWIDTGGVLREFSWPEHTQVELFHVTDALAEEHVDSLLSHGSTNVPNSTQLVQEYRAAIDKRKEATAARLKQLQREAPEIIKTATLEVDQGDVVEQIVHKVERDDIDLLVVSSRRLSIIGRLLGSTTESLLSRCPCSLLIVHDQPQATRKTDSLAHHHATHG